MMFMACSSLALVFRTRCSAKRCAAEPGPISLTVHVGPGSAARHKRAALRPGHKSNPRHIELRPLTGAVAPQRAGLADRVGALKDPVLPRRQARKDFRFHGLGSDEAQVRFHAGEAVGRKTGALLEEHPDLVVPVDVVERKGDEAELLGFLGIKRLADSFLCALQIRWIGLKARL